MMTKKKRPLDPDQIAFVVLKVVEEAKQKGIAVALIGGVAMQYYGSDRLTYDVDFAAGAALETDFKPGGGQRLLTFGGHQMTILNVPVDIIVRSDEYQNLYQAALAEAVILDDVPIVQPEHLAALKLAAMRPKDDLDFDFLIEVGIVVPKARAFIKKHLGAFAAAEFDNRVSQALWNKSRR